MDDTHTQDRTPRRSLRRLRGPLLVSLLVHGLGLGAALWWTLRLPTPAAETATIGRVALRPVAEPEILPPEIRVEPPALEETPAVEDALEAVLLEHAPDEPEPLFRDESTALAPEPPTFAEVPLSAARRARVPPPAPVALPPAPTPRPRVVVRPAPRAAPRPPPRVAPSPVRRAPLRVVWAPDPRRYYPASALRRGLGGRALVRLTIDREGRVTRALLERTSGHVLLDRAAVSLAYAYRFTAGSTARTTRLPVTFRPPGGGLGS